MQIKKTYDNLQPELLYYELKDFFLQQGMVLGTNKLETFSTQADSTATIFQGTLTFKTASEPVKECVRAHMQGATKGQTKLVLDLDEEVVDEKQISALKEDIDFFFGTYEAAVG